jgi:hypothetical protein
MLTTNARRVRQVAGWTVWATLACAALLVTACNSSSSSAAASASSPASAPATPSSPSSASGPASAPASPPASPSVTASATGTSTFLAQGQDINGTALYRPACNSGCPLSGDSTAILDKMRWSTWSATEAVGTGIYKLDGCNPSCAAGPIYSVATVVTLSDPVKVCSSSGTRWFWTRASFTFPRGLPKALQGDSAPKNPWVFSTVASAAQQSCAG